MCGDLCAGLRPAARWSARGHEGASSPSRPLMDQLSHFPLETSAPGRPAVEGRPHGERASVASRPQPDGVNAKRSAWVKGSRSKRPFGTPSGTISDNAPYDKADGEPMSPLKPAGGCANEG